MPLFGKNVNLTMGRNIALVYGRTEEEFVEELDKIIESGKKIKDIKFQVDTGFHFQALIIFERDE